MPQIVDLTRTRNKYADSSQAIGNILNTIGKLERLRQERALNNKVLNAIASGKTTPQEIAQVLISAEPQYDAGPVGFLQKIADKFAPPSPMMTGAAQQAAQGALDPYTQARIKAAEALTAQRTDALNMGNFRLVDRYLRLSDDAMTQAHYRYQQGDDYEEYLVEANDYRQKAQEIVSQLEQGGRNPATDKAKQWLDEIEQKQTAITGPEGPPTPKPKAEPKASVKGTSDEFVGPIPEQPYRKEYGNLDTKMYRANTTPDERLGHKVSYAKQEPEAAAESYREHLLKNGYTEKDLAELLEVFKGGDEEKIKQALKIIGIY